ncbi:MAG: YceD family protein [Kiritimatiellia bacterium]
MDEKFSIDVARLDADGEDLSGVLDDAVLEMADDPYLRPFAGIRYELFAQVLGTELLVRGRLAQDFDAVCSRCGADFDFTVTVPDFTASVEVGEKTEFVDLTDELRQCIILALPTYPVCREDCRGVCAMCGKNLNEGSCACSHDEQDSRWGALDALELEK